MTARGAVHNDDYVHFTVQQWLYIVQNHGKCLQQQDDNLEVRWTRDVFGANNQTFPR
jgi:Tfp pilus assembly protein PilP